LRWVEQLTGHDLKGVPLPRVDEVQGIIENHVGFMPLPMSIAAPLVIHGDYARGEFIVPLCTLEGTLTLALNRGLLAMAMAGGCRTIHLKQELSRSPAFCLPTITEIGSFLDWINDHADSILVAAESTTRHGRLLRVDPTPIQQWVVLDFVYDTGNAAGQNMVTLATEAACRHIQQETGFHYYLESGFNSDKKPSRRNLMNGRGHSVTVEYSLSGQILDSLGVRQEAVLEFQQLAMTSSQAARNCRRSGATSSCWAAAAAATTLASSPRSSRPVPPRWSSRRWSQLSPAKLPRATSNTGAPGPINLRLAANRRRGDEDAPRLRTRPDRTWSELHSLGSHRHACYSEKMLDPVRPAARAAPRCCSNPGGGRRSSAVSPPSTSTNPSDPAS